MSWVNIMNWIYLALLQVLKGLYIVTYIVTHLIVATI